MKFYTAAGVFKYSWEQVAEALWIRYPNPHSKHVLTEDTFYRRLDGNRLYSTRVLSKTNRMPKVAERFVGKVRDIIVVEESIVDRDEQKITTYTRNIGLSKVMTIEEKVTYTPSKDNKEWTLCEKQAWISSNLFGVSYLVQAFGLERFRSNATKAREGFEHVLAHMFRAPSDEVVLAAATVMNGQAAIAAHAIRDSQAKLKSKAARAKELAKDKAAPVVAKYARGTTAS